MQRSLLLLASLVALGTAQASEVFVTKDAQGNAVYTDRPESLPAQKVKVASRSTDTVEVQRQYDEKMQATAAADKAGADAAKQATESRQAKELTAADKAKRCLDARTRYQQVMTAQRLYEPGTTEGERRYLDSKEIDAARASSKQTMDEFCAGQ
jgi:Domain of unknown function (DUF4124)